MAVVGLPVLVVGAGPTGLVLAGELLRRGVAVRLVDKASRPTDQSRAIAVHARTLEIFDELGIAASLIDRGVAAEGVTMMSGGVEIASLDFAGLPTKFPFALCVSQVETEAVLTDLLRARGGEIERGRELVSFVERDDAVGRRGGHGALLRGGRQRTRAPARNTERTSGTPGR